MERFKLKIPMAAIALVTCVLPASTIAEPGTSCADRAQMQQFLTRTFRERQVGHGMVDAKMIMEIYVSDSGTWTVMVTNTDGIACIIATGDEWDGPAWTNPRFSDLDRPA